MRHCMAIALKMQLVTIRRPEHIRSNVGLDILQCQGTNNWMDIWLHFFTGMDTRLFDLNVSPVSIPI